MRPIRRTVFPLLIVSAETDNKDKIEQLITAVAEYPVAIQIDYSFALDFGLKTIRRLVDTGAPIIFDAKLYDRPGAAMAEAGAISRLGVTAFTAHLAGGEDMLEAVKIGAAKGAGGVNRRPAIIGITVPTHLTDEALAEVGRESIARETEACIQMATSIGCEGIVCAAPDLRLMTEQTRGALPMFVDGAGTHSTIETDHRRTLSAQAAIDIGAEHLIIGRQITATRNMRKAIKSTLEHIMNPSLTDSLLEI